MIIAKKRRIYCIATPLMQGSMLAVPQCLVVFVRMIVAIAAQFAAIYGQQAQRDAHNDTEDILGFKAK
jgi:hypothetical protein